MTTTIPCPPPIGCTPMSDDDPPRERFSDATRLSLALQVLREVEYVHDGANYVCPECYHRRPREADPTGHEPLCGLARVLRGTW